MAVYVVWLALSFVASILLIFKTNKLYLYAAFIIISSLPLMSGTVGTDAWVYDSYYKTVAKLGCGNAELEPLFCWLVYIFGIFFGVEYVRNVIAVLIAFFLAFPIRTEPLYSKQYRIAVVYFALLMDFSMNGVRQGLAFAFILFALQRVGTKSVFLRYSAYLISTFIHASSLLFAVFNEFKGYFTKFFVVFVVPLIFSGFSILLLLNPSLVSRFQDSLSVAPFSFLSGYAPFFINFILIWVFWRHRFFKKGVLLFFCLCSAMFLIFSRISNVGVRLLQLEFYFLLMFPLLIQIQIPKKVIISCMVVIALFFTLRLRNFAIESELKSVPTAFLPYKFFWE